MFGKPYKISRRHAFRTLFIAFLTATALFAAVLPPVSGQNQTTVFKNAVLSVSPEYDDLLNLGSPSVLVMYEGEIVSPGLTKITFLVPSSASMYSAGSGPRTQYVVGDSLNRTTSNLTGWDEVSFIPKSNFFVVEYYAPIQGAPDRLLPFEFRTVHPVNNLRIIVQEPRRSTKFTITPVGTVGTDQEGFKVHTYNLQSVSPDQPLPYNITYSKKDTRPSTGAGSGGPTSNTTLIVIVTAVIVVGALVLLFLPQFRGNSGSYQSRSQRRQAERNTQKRQSTGQSKSKFCPTCGKPVQGTDRFCPACGNPL